MLRSLTIYLPMLFIADSLISFFMKMKPERGAVPGALVFSYTPSKKLITLVSAALMVALAVFDYLYNDQKLSNTALRLSTLLMLLIAAVLTTATAFSLKFVLTRSGITRKTCFRTVTIGWHEVVEVESKDGGLDTRLHIKGRRAKISLSSLALDLSYFAQAIRNNLPPEKWHAAKSLVNTVIAEAQLSAPR